jgi:hypothetical protein
MKHRASVLGVFAGLSAGLLLFGCATSRQTHSTGTVICDYGSQFLYEAKTSGPEKAIADVLGVLRCDDRYEQERLATEFLFRDDELLPFLRNQAASGKDGVEIRFLLCFIGDKSDLEEFDVPGFEFERPAHSTSAVDLSEALALFRESAKLITHDFRTTGLVYNHSMTKAYVQVTLGPGAFSSSGWGLMFHKIQGKWVLMWSRFEWVS